MISAKVIKTDNDSANVQPVYAADEMLQAQCCEVV